MRWYAQDALNGSWLSRDVPLSGAEASIGINGADALRATIEPEFAMLKDDQGRPLLREWGTFLYGEENDEIQAGYILSSSNLTGQSWEIEAQAFADYPRGATLAEDTVISETDVDPLDVTRMIWTHLQSQPDSDIGMELASTRSNVRLGTGHDDEGKPKPYTLNWWDSPDVGNEIDQLAGDTPFDFREVHLWQDFQGSPKETVRHVLQLGFPRLGVRRHELRLVEGENITDVISVTRAGDDYANNIVVLGAGEGRKMVRGQRGQRHDRLRRTKVVTDKTIRSEYRADAMARDLLAASLPVPEVTSCVVTDHPNAPLGSFAPGDDVLIQARVGWSEQSLWHRILTITFRPDEETQELSLRRADAFVYEASV